MAPMKKKYVITQDGLPILFDESLIHKNVSSCYSVASAGFCDIHYSAVQGKIKVRCWGESSSLHIRSNPVLDSEIIENLLNS